jgi:hypothetical protein
MISISEFFKRIGGIQAREITFRVGVQAAIRESIGMDVPIESITFKSGGIILKDISQAARTAIFIKKINIIEQANMFQSIHRITDIR